MKKLTTLLLPVILLLLTMSAVQAKEDALFLEVDQTELLPGDMVIVTVSVDPPQEAITGIESYINFDSAVFEAVGGGPECTSSDFSDITVGSWFIEGCLTEDVSGGKSYLTTSKSILFEETGYGVITQTQELYAYRLQVLDTAPLGETVLTLSNTDNRLTKIYIDGIQYIQDSSSVVITVSDAPSPTNTPTPSPTENPQQDDDSNNNDDDNQNQDEEDSQDDDGGVIFDDPDEDVIVGKKIPSMEELRAQGVSMDALREKMDQKKADFFQENMNQNENDSQQDESQLSFISRLLRSIRQSFRGMYESVISRL